MKCRQFQKLTSQRPRDRTTAEYAAIIAHYGKCGPCRNWLREHCAGIPKTTAGRRRLAEDEADLDRLNEKARHDPEAIGIIRSAFRRKTRTP
jgi:hypothetical protein